ncbi:hypothetical protein LCE31_36760, partial [Streptomyces sp. 8L]|nr:hypothetical protein [Streptomyces sp. 8L]
MARKPRRDISTSPCPNPACGEPVEPGDLFCGACGYDLTSAPLAAGGADHPTVALGPSGGRGAEHGADGGADRGVAPVSWPDAVPDQGADAAVGAQHPGDLPGVDSHGAQLPPNTGDFVLPSPGRRSPGEHSPGEPPSGERRTGGPAAPSDTSNTHAAVPDGTAQDTVAGAHDHAQDAAAPETGAPDAAAPDAAAPDAGAPVSAAAVDL